MLVTLKEVLQIAEKKKIAIGSFNTPGLEYVMAVLAAAEQNNVPVIIMHAQVHEPIISIDIIGPIMIEMAKKSSVPVCVHLDHCEELDYLEKALKLGFTSVMYDGSLLPYEENTANTIKAVEYAKKYGASVEAEIGILAGREAGSAQELTLEQMYTDPALAKEFVERTNIDALAASFGTAHGFYTKKPKLDFDRIKKISELVSVPLVMHGGSGLDILDYKRAIMLGVRKINYYSYMSKAGLTGVSEFIGENNNVQFFHEIAAVAICAMKKNTDCAIKMFSNDI